MTLSHWNKSLMVLTLALAPLAACAATPEKMRGGASPALVTLATTGNPVPLRKELGGKIVSSADLQKKAASKLNLKKKEHLAPKALITPSGDMYAMVAPVITKDNFIYVHQGKLVRMDVGWTEGTNKPFVVTQIVEDGGASIWAEIGHWFSNVFSGE